MTLNSNIITEINDILRIFPNLILLERNEEFLIFEGLFSLKYSSDNHKFLLEFVFSQNGTNNLKIILSFLSLKSNADISQNIALKFANTIQNLLSIKK